MEICENLQNTLNFLSGNNVPKDRHLEDIHMNISNSFLRNILLKTPELKNYIIDIKPRVLKREDKDLLRIMITSLENSKKQNLVDLERHYSEQHVSTTIGSLCDMFPETKTSKIQELMQIHSNNYDKVLQVLLESGESGEQSSATPGKLSLNKNVSVNVKGNHIKNKEFEYEKKEKNDFNFESDDKFEVNKDLFDLLNEPEDPDAIQPQKNKQIQNDSQQSDSLSGSEEEESNQMEKDGLYIKSEYVGIGRDKKQISTHVKDAIQEYILCFMILTHYFIDIRKW